jgi:hypothetical protein
VLFAGHDSIIAAALQNPPMRYVHTNMRVRDIDASLRF